MKVVFSEHAIKRCTQQNISISRLRKEISTLPMIGGKMRWISKQKCVVVFEKIAENTVKIVTVTSLMKYKETKGIYFDRS